MSASIVPIYLATNVDNAWSVAPGALQYVLNFAPLQSGAYGSAGITDKGWTITGTDHVSAYILRKVDGTLRLFVNRATNIDEYDSSGTRTNRATGLTTTTDWSMCAHGNAVIACSIDNATQVSTGAGFSALGGGSPKAKHCASNRGFVMLAHTDTSPDQVWWSALYNYASFTPSIATEAGNVRLLEAPGPITALIAYRDGFVAFKNNAIFVAEYVGPNYIWDWRIVSNKVGCVGSKAVCELDGRLYFMHTSGFYEFDGQNLRNVGLPILQTFLVNSGYVSITGMSYAGGGSSLGLGYVQAVADDIDGVVWFKHVSVRSVTFKYDDFYYGYNARTQKWGVLAGNGNSDTNQVVLRASSSDLRDFNGSSANLGRFWLLQSPSATTTMRYVDYPAATTGSNAATLSTGVIGSFDSSAKLSRVYWRTLYGTTADTGVALTATGYTTENKLITNGSATGACNAELDYGDVNINAKFQAVTLTWTVGKITILAGLGIELQKGGAPR